MPWESRETVIGLLEESYQEITFVVTLWVVGGSQVALVVKNPPANAGDRRDVGSVPGSRRSPEEEMTPHSSTFSWSIHGQRSLVIYSPWCHKELDMSEHLSHMTCFPGQAPE